MPIQLPPPVAFVDSNLSNYLRWTTNRRPPDETALFTEPQARAMIAAEREACAKVCEDGYFLHDQAPSVIFGKECARAIRARGAK